MVLATVLFVGTFLFVTQKVNASTNIICGPDFCPIGQEVYYFPCSSDICGNFDTNICVVCVSD